MAGTTVIIKGTTKGTITDNKGRFKLNEVPKDGELVFSFVGYQTFQTRADAENTMVIKMAPQRVGIEKVVVGYEKANTPPASPSAMRIIVNPPYHYSPDKNIAQLEQEFLKNSSGYPPLLLYDGAVISKSAMESINPDEIGYIDAFKDLAATNKYGERGKNGVIEIVSKNKMNHEERGKDLNSIVFNDPKNKPLIYLDGAVIDLRTMSGLNPEQIESTHVWKGKEATDKFGEKGKYGVVEITSKKSGAANPSPGQTNQLGYHRGKEKTDQPFVVVEQMPQFPGGYKALVKFINEHLRYPANAYTNKIQGIININFIVSRSGRIVQVKVVKRVDPELDAEALRVIRSMPDWQPGRQHGEAVDVSMTIPIQFALRWRKTD